MSSPPQPPIAGGPAGGGPPPPPPYSSPPPQQPYGAQPPQYGSLAPQYGSVAVQPYGPSPAAAAAAPKRRKGLMLSGIAVAVVGIGAGVALVALSGAATERTVEQFARAPVGCTTTLEFERTGTFTLFVETKGKVAAVEGDCAATGVGYDRGDDDLPRVSLSLVDSAGSPIELAAASSPSYVAGAFEGQAIQEVLITQPGTYRLTVTSEDTDFAVAVGGDPDADAATMKTIGIVVALGGLLLGGLLLLLGRRARGEPPAAPSLGAPWQPVAPTVPGWSPQATATWPPVSPGYPPATAVVPPPVAPPPPPDQGWAAPQQ